MTEQSEIDQFDTDQPETENSEIPLIGYTDRLSVRPGETIGFKVSSRSADPFRARLVRVICADPNPAGPGIIEDDVEAEFSGEYPSRHQPFYPGSYARVDGNLTLGGDGSFTLAATIWPTAPGRGEQAVLSVGEATLMVCADGSAGGIAGSEAVSTGAPLKERHWYIVWLSYDAENGTLTAGQAPAGDGGVDAGPVSASASISAFTLETGTSLTIAAAIDDGIAVEHFNGKIEAPVIFASPYPKEDAVVAHWDFSQDIETTVIRDVGPSGLDGHLINLPTRAMTGSSWDASEMCWRHAPDQYGAIHFHDDDIYDFGWDTDFSFTVPADLPSGVYAARIMCGEAEDAMPFFVCPPKDKSEGKGKRKADLCVLVSTFTYAVYGNHARPDFDPSWKDRMAEWGAYPWNPAEHREYGLSTYNYHSDGSGICHASHRRPLFNLRPGYITFGAGEDSGLRHFQADSHLISWLHAKGIDYDIITDEELHNEGAAVLDGYRAVTTGSHPEYHTPETLDALQGYRDNGGRLLYLGGNGFYWRVALHGEESGAIEIRRAESGIRAWAAEPGEYYNAFDGAYGGLWRRNGRPPQKLAGVGFSAQGQFNGSYYRRNATCDDPCMSWIFDGIDDDIIGDFGFSGGGAAGFELDRADTRLGTPDTVVVVASSEGHGADFVLVPEEQLTHLTTWPGEPVADLLRADMVYFEVPGGGAVFSTGSITFCGSLPHNDFNNNVSRLLGNVMKRFLAS